MLKHVEIEWKHNKCSNTCSFPSTKVLFWSISSCSCFSVHSLFAFALWLWVFTLKENFAKVISLKLDLTWQKLRQSFEGGQSPTLTGDVSRSPDRVRGISGAWVSCWLGNGVGECSSLQQRKSSQKFSSVSYRGEKLFCWSSRILEDTQKSQRLASLWAKEVFLKRNKKKYRKKRRKWGKVIRIRSSVQNLFQNIRQRRERNGGETCRPLRGFIWDWSENLRLMKPLRRRSVSPPFLSRLCLMIACLPVHLELWLCMTRPGFQLAQVEHLSSWLSTKTNARS